MAKKPFNDAQVEIWKKFTETLFHGTHMAITPQQVVDNLQVMFAEMHGDKPCETGLSLYVIWLALGGPFFHFASPTARKRKFEKKLQNRRVDLFQDFARIRGIIYAGYYGHWLGGEHGSEEDNADNPVLKSLDFTLPTARQRAGAPQDPPVVEETSGDLPPSVFFDSSTVPAEAEVIVIGSGAGGAVAAANLAASGYKVLILEAGEHFPASRITTHEKIMSSNLYRDGAIQTTRNRDIIVFQGQVVGGSPVINNGIALRAAPHHVLHPQAENVLDIWASLGAPVSRTDLDTSYDRVETRLDIKPIAKRLGRNNGTHLIRAWNAYKPTSNDALDQDAVLEWFSKNWGAYGTDRACVSAGYCNTGCPYGRKNAPPETWLADATKAATPAYIVTECEAEEILWDGRNDAGERIANAVAVKFRDGTRKAIRATKGVVVAAGTIASSNILDASRIKGTGEGISLNIACPVPALMEKRQNAWDEDQMATYVDRGDFLIESHFQPPMSMSTLVPGWFEEHYQRMRNYSRLASAGVLFPADRLGELKNGKLDFHLDDHTLNTLKRALATLSKVQLAGGALEVYPALLRGQTLWKGMDNDAVDAFFRDNIKEADDVVLSSSHPHGGNAINSDPKKGVVDLDQKVHGTSNVYVTDASVMPSCIRVNAMLTTMAMADRVTHGKRIFG
ncbi:GMC family oxidoreductase N-terminal domain-containing protein [Alterisphingorhabdus coralli]|uniref:GMC family oxidoreductase N-terminal domain-containing protein n=1 Tax=Alterisphingorhabdus coralli TaxID=3071408 RepID=A0AA97F539_9SPHN|nr:GMC family oxidoreductase N-terminal domain-containing protein [Parasphingorhabdus sp. SCSIO 66989]WOE74381.1 GMC family oxidoreductase N-terminal domain-containing protein [Parasphingorhabdus sp. SCSIO 66989]